MRLALFVGLLTGVLAGVLAAPAAARAEIQLTTEGARTAAADPTAASALASVKALDEAVLAQDAAAFSAFLAHDLAVNTPRNSAHFKAGTIAMFSAGGINYRRYDREIELVQVRGADTVVFMGAEQLEPIGAAPNAGTIVRRRFTDVWRRDPDGAWRLTVRQATIIALE